MYQKTARWFFAFFMALTLAGPLAFGQQAPPPAVDAAKKQAVVDEISTLLDKNYVFPDTAKKIGDALHEKLRAGEFDKAANVREFAQAVAKVLADVGKDRHMGFVFNPEMANAIRHMRSQSEAEKSKERERQLQESRRDNFGFRKVERLPGNIGYLDFRVFESPDVAGPTAIAALNFLAHCDAIIVDLRQNGGGDPAQIQLICSYFFDEPVHLNDLYFRAADRTDNFWTLPYVPGPKPAHADLYILTSSRSFSGAEEFTYNMKNLKRATVIGETTGGGAHPTDAMIVQESFILRVPVARAINPVSKTNWEGTGVSPDIAVPAAQAYDRAYSLALEKLAAKAADPQLKSEYEWIQADLKAKSNPARVDEKILKSYVGVYGERKVTMEGGALFYQRTGPKYRLIPLTETLFVADGVEDFHLEFVVKNGRAVEVVGVTPDGQRDPSPRTK